MTHAVDFPEPVFPVAVMNADPATFPSILCDSKESHLPHVWIGAWNHGDLDPRECPGLG